MTRPVSSLLAIDSGYPRCTLAAAVGGRVVYLDSYDPVASRGSLGGMACGSFDRVVVEIPSVRPDTPDANDLILIAVAGARVAERFARDPCTITEYRPLEWKGTTPKPPHHRRMWDELTDSERKLLGGAKTLAAIDAACLRGARDRWRKKGALYYRASELPKVNGEKMTHDKLDAAALALYALGRIRKG